MCRCTSIDSLLFRLSFGLVFFPVFLFIFISFPFLFFFVFYHSRCVRAFIHRSAVVEFSLCLLDIGFYAVCARTRYVRNASRPMHATKMIGFDADAVCSSPNVWIFRRARFAKMRKTGRLFSNGDARMARARMLATGHSTCELDFFFSFPNFAVSRRLDAAICQRASLFHRSLATLSYYSAKIWISFV